MSKIIGVHAKSPSTNWTSYSLTIGGTTTAPTKGTTTRDSARWRRVGDSIEIEYDYKQTGAGSAGSGSYLFSLPSGITIDSSKAPLSLDGTVEFGVASLGTGADGYVSFSNGIGKVIALSSTTFSIVRQVDSGGNFGVTRDVMGSSVFSLSNTSIILTVRARFPVVGWSSNDLLRTSNGTKV